MLQRFNEAEGNNLAHIIRIHSDKPEFKSQSKVKGPNPETNPKKGGGNLNSGLSLNSYGPPTT